MQYLSLNTTPPSSEMVILPRSAINYETVLAAKHAASAVSDVCLPQKSPFKPQIVNFRKKCKKNQQNFWSLNLLAHYKFSLCPSKRWIDFALATVWKIKWKYAIESSLNVFTGTKNKCNPESISVKNQ